MGREAKGVGVREGKGIEYEWRVRGREQGGGRGKMNVAATINYCSK